MFILRSSTYSLLSSRHEKKSLWYPHLWLTSHDTHRKVSQYKNPDNKANKNSETRPRTARFSLKLGGAIGAGLGGITRAGGLGSVRNGATACTDRGVGRTDRSSGVGSWSVFCRDRNLGQGNVLAGSVDVDAGNVLYGLFRVFLNLRTRCTNRVLWFSWVYLLVYGSGRLWSRGVVDGIECRNCSGVRLSDDGSIDWLSKSHRNCLVDVNASCPASRNLSLRGGMRAFSTDGLCDDRGDGSEASGADVNVGSSDNGRGSSSRVRWVIL